MIEVATNTAIMIYLAIFLTVIMGLWLYTHVIKRHKKIITTEQRLMLCEYCQCAYVEDQTKEVTKCPECQSYNKNNFYKRDKQMKKMHPKVLQNGSFCGQVTRKKRSTSKPTS